MRAKQNLAIGLLCTTALAGLLLICNMSIFPGVGIISSNNAYAETETVAKTAIRVNSTCSMTANIETGEEHTVAMTPTINGQYKEDIGITTIQTFCNDPSGYAIYAIGYTGGDIGVANGVNTVLHSSALGSDYDIRTGTATSGDTSNWAMKLTAVDGDYKPTILNNYDDYNVVPESYTKVARFNSNTDQVVEGSTLTTTYAAYVKPTQPAGTYIGQVKYVLLHPASALEPGTYYMQDVDEWGPSLAIGQEIIAYDNRDNKSYTVRRMCMEGAGDTWQEMETSCIMEDSMLWMTQNLDLCIGCAGTNTITSENTNITEYQKDGVNFAGYTIDEFGLVTWTPTASTMTGDPAVLTNQYTTQGYQILSKQTWNDYGPAMTEGGDLYFAQGVRHNSLSGCENAGYTKAECAHYHVGNYYNWSAAVAMSDTSSYTTNYTVMPNSICPKGWRLPNGPTLDQDNNIVQSDFYKLFFAYNLVNEVTSGTSENENVGWRDGDGFVNAGLSPFYFVRQGYVLGDQLRYYIANAYYQSSTVGGGNNTYFSDYNINSARLAAKDNRIGGRAVRCVSDY